MIHRHHSSDITPTTSSKKDATTTTDADDEDTSADNATNYRECYRGRILRCQIQSPDVDG